MASRTSFLRVRFNEAPEFVRELEQDRELVERGLVRVTKAYRPAMGGVLTRVTVLAGAIVDGRPVILERLVGDLWGNPAADNLVNADADAYIATLEAEVQRLGLTARGGLLEENDA